MIKKGMTRIFSSWGGGRLMNMIQKTKDTAELMP